MSQKSSEKAKIDGHEYEVFMLPPKKARKILVELFKVAAPAVGAAVDNGGGVKSIMEFKVDDLKWSALLSLLADKITDEMMDDHMNHMAQFTHVDGKPLGDVFDIHFRGAIGTMFKWWGFALRVNFGNFTSALESASALLPKQEEKAKA